MAETIKQSTFDEIIESEKDMLLHASDVYGNYFINAFEFNILLNNFIKPVDDIEKFIFIAFLTQIEKHHTLALFSSVRLHHIQTGMNLRQVLEAGAWAAYAMGNKKKEKFYEQDIDGTSKVPEKLQKARNDWIEQNFKDGSDAIRRSKNLINSSVAHSNIIYSFQNFSVKKIDDNRGFSMSFFDHYDELIVKTDLWFIANIALGLLDLFYGINKKYKVFKFVDDFMPRFKNLVKQNNGLKLEMMKNPRISKFVSQN